MQNLFPNSQWQVITAYLPIGKIESDGVTVTPAVNVSGYSVGSPLVTCYTSDTSSIEVGDVGYFSATVDPYMRIGLMEVESISANQSFTVRCPINLSPSTSAACTFQPMTVGDYAGAGSISGPDGWSKSGTLKFWRDLSPSVNNAPGATHALGVQKGSSSTEYLYCSTADGQNGINADDFRKFLGRDFTVRVSSMMKVGTVGCRPFIQTDAGFTYGPYITSSSHAEAELTVTIPQNSTFIARGYAFDGAIGDTFMVCNPMSAFASSLGAGSYQQPVGEWLIPTVKYSPVSYIGATISFPSAANSVGDYGFPFNPYAECGAAISPTVKQLRMQLEGSSSTNGMAIGIRNAEAPPAIYGVLLYTQNTTHMFTTAGVLTLGRNGKGYTYSNKQSANFGMCSIDINGIRLN